MQFRINKRLRIVDNKNVQISEEFYRKFPNEKNTYKYNKKITYNLFTKF